ncbi:MAG: hypothetical protein ABJF04_04755 [Reichenbachiella sp.]|uniref:hypothetical protein n=1 Tax=Reichenbachiella sp. TaxID=2184521 RepID=UPI0032669BF7
MKIHRKVFEELKNLLTEELGGNITEHERGTYIEINETNIWFSTDEHEFTVAYGIVHNHYDPEFEVIKAAIDRLFNLLTCRIKKTNFLKGDFTFKHRIDLELPNGELENVGTGMTWLYPYWKKTIQKVSFSNNLIERDKINEQIEKIKDYA